MLKIDFASAAHNFRRLHGGGRNQPIARAVGIKKYGLPLSIIDATAGLGSDAFVLASIGCEVTLLERNDTLYNSLQSAIDCAPEGIADIISRMQIIYGNAIELLKTLQADVVYLDPMFPERSKTALVKQEMRELKKLVGEDQDQDSLLLPARQAATKRVVVKRPKGARYLNNEKPHTSMLGKSNRFDIYMPIQK